MESTLLNSTLEGDIANNNDKSFFSLFKGTVLRNSIKSAIIFEDNNGYKKSISYKHMDEASNQISNVLLRIYNTNKLSNTIVAILLPPTEYLPIILLAILKAGLSYLPLDIEFPIERIKYILADAQPFICIIDETVDASICNISTITDKTLLFKSHDESKIELIEERKSSIALIIYTSGSSGTPKGVRLPFSALINRLSWQWKRLPFMDDEEFCIFKTALTFVDSVCEIWSPLLQGRTLIVVPKHTTKDPEKFVFILNKYKIQRIVLVPSLLKSTIAYLRYQQDRKSLEILKLWVCSGETLSSALVQEFFKWFSNKNKMIANFYGSTEVMGDVTFYLIQENDLYLKEDKIPIGKPIDNCIVYITDDHLNLVPCGQIGEILIAGKNLSHGYINDHNATKFIKNPFSSRDEYSEVFRTGDYGRIENNDLFYEGRQDNQIKIRGYRIDLTEIEKVVLDLPNINEAVIMSYKTNEIEQILLCFIVTKQTAFDLDLTKFHLEQKLLTYMMPKLIIIDKIPLLTNGKTDRLKLLEHYKMLENEKTKEYLFDYSDVPTALLKEANILFTTIASIIGSVEKTINIHCNFYELGGNSLNSVYTVLKLREKGLNIGITDFITAKSFKDILFNIKFSHSTDFSKNDLNSEQYNLEMLNDTHKKEVMDMITESFFTKADLEKWLIPDIKKQDYSILIQSFWKPLVQKGFSFVLKSIFNDQVLSVALNFDARDEPNITVNSKLKIIFDFLEYLEQPIKDARLPQGKNKIFHTFMMATSIDLSASDNVILMRLMEEKCLEIAKNHNFSGILTTNTSPLTQQLGTDIFNYEVMLDYQVNQYVTTDGHKPFEKAPENQRAIVAWKKIDN